MPASLRSTLPLGLRNGSNRVRASATRDGPRDMKLSSQSGWEASRGRAVWTLPGASLKPELADAPGKGWEAQLQPLCWRSLHSKGQREQEWGVQREKQRPGSNPEHMPSLLQRQGEGPFSLLGTGRAVSSAHRLSHPDFHRSFARFQFSYHLLFCGVITTLNEVWKVPYKLQNKSQMSAVGVCPATGLCSQAERPELPSFSFQRGWWLVGMGRAPLQAFTPIAGEPSSQPWGPGLLPEPGTCRLRGKV